MPGPLSSHLDDGDHRQDLVLLTTDAETGAVVGAVPLGDGWDHLLRALVADAGRQARVKPGAAS